jgi:hypothetical protein
MPRIDIASCEPFRAWNRLEPRTRQADFDEVLKCAVHDPLWMLTRQWQFGEFQGEDTGSAIFTKIKVQSTNLSRYKSANETVENYTDAIPAEAKVESQFPREDYYCQVEAGIHFLKLLGQVFKTNPVAPAYNRNDYLQALMTDFPLSLPPDVFPADDHTATVLKLKQRIQEPLNSFLAAFGGRIFDGKKLFEAAVTSIPAATATVILNPAHTGNVTTTLSDFINWYRAHNKPAHNSSGNGAWKNEQLEYQFAFAAPEKNSDNTILTADEYYTGKLDWYSFDVVEKSQTIPGLSGASTTEEKAGITEKTITVIPTPAQFTGMPNPRWWQFEDGGVDLGNIDADTTDLSKLVVSEFALMYGNDWLIVPYEIPTGTLTQIEGLIVTDVFGVRSQVIAATQGTTDDWDTWGLFNLSTRNAENQKNIKADTRLFIPPATVRTHESEPLEEILFVRDEMANMVWAIENKFNHGAGGSMDGHTAANYLKNAIELIEPPGGAIEVDETAMYKYTLENTVPENWIPFIPVQLPGQHRAIRLQRASMPRWFKNEYAPVRPNTELLRTGINESDVVDEAYFVNEEEVPRAGARVSLNFQRTRWYHGQVINWLGRRKNSGRGEGSSGLQFDFLEPIKKEEPA